MIKVYIAQEGAHSLSNEQTAVVKIIKINLNDAMKIIKEICCKMIVKKRTTKVFCKCRVRQLLCKRKVNEET